MQVTTLSDMMAKRPARTLGTLTASIVLTIPRVDQSATIKPSTLVRWSYIDIDQARTIKEDFLSRNDELDPAFIQFKWTAIPEVL
jgi:hypothetical protein